METHTLLPLSQAELQGRPNDFLHRAQTQDGPPLLPRSNLQDVALAGGPEMRERATLARRQAWAKAYMSHIMERDVQDIARIDQLVQIPNLLNLTQLGLDAKTANRYVGVLERLFLGQRLLTWTHHEGNRLIKTPKLHFLDAGLQATLTRLTPELLQVERTRWGATLATWVYAELRKAHALPFGDRLWAVPLSAL